MVSWQKAFPVTKNKRNKMPQRLTTVNSVGKASTWKPVSMGDPGIHEYIIMPKTRYRMDPFIHHVLSLVNNHGHINHIWPWPMIIDISSYRIIDEVQNNMQSFFVSHNLSTSFSYRTHRNRFSTLEAQTRYRRVSTHLQLLRAFLRVAMYLRASQYV